MKGMGYRIMEEQCDTCIFRPGNLMDLNPGRVKGMVRDATSRDSFIVCHDTFDEGCEPDDLSAVCAGFAEKRTWQLRRIAERVGMGPQYVKGRQDA